MCNVAWCDEFTLDHYAIRHWTEQRVRVAVGCGEAADVRSGFARAIAACASDDSIGVAASGGSPVSQTCPVCGYDALKRGRHIVHGKGGSPGHCCLAWARQFPKNRRPWSKTTAHKLRHWTNLS